MCGIWAIIGFHADTMKLLRDFQTIKGRGPDSYRIENLNHFKDCCLGFHRLSIVGDMDGMQPIRIKGMPHINVLCNGEIYNHKLIGKEHNIDYTTHCDVECILHLYEEMGMVEACRQLEGVFGIFLMDTDKRKVFIARDTFGVRPAFYVLTKSGFLGASSEMKGLINILPRLSEEDRKEARIVTLPPGSVIEFDLRPDGTVDPDTPVITRFHKIGTSPVYHSIAYPDNTLEPRENIRRLLNAAVKKRLMSERRIGCFLSGGLDSSLISGLLARNMKEAGIDYPLQTFSIGMKDSVDVLAARKVSQFLGTEHHEVSFSPEEGTAAVDEVIQTIESYDVTTIRASVGMYLISKFVQENSDSIVLFSGEGSDELTGGYIYFHRAPNAIESDAECRRLLEDLHYFDVLRCDRSIARWGLEPRVPFLDHQFTSYYLSLDPELRMPKDGVEKSLLRSAFSGQNLIPEEILWRPKEAFSDGVSSKEKSWFEVLNDHVEGQISDDELATAADRFPFNTPRTKEAFYYRSIFESYYPNQSHNIPYYWMPKWSGDVTNPSARTLDHYKQTDVKDI